MSGHCLSILLSAIVTKIKRIEKIRKIRKIGKIDCDMGKIRNITHDAME